ncbi:hypothetical protein ALC53_02018 [Atta colombica]|uniref:Uncharacterized protein n=1 Tax=Atta colombica TaxID=520822 RepID=A0A195BTE6_9HYME|nr:hypothetical protein ALC53_02018 [Atta colombica]
MDEADALMRADDGGGVITSNVNDDGAPTIEETYEITTTRRKTIRTSYKIQERVVHFGYYWYRLVVPYDGLVFLEVANADYVKFTKLFRCGRFSIPRYNVFSVRRSDEREDPPSRLSSHVRQTAAILRHCQDDDFRTGNELASNAETTGGNISLQENIYERGRVSRPEIDRVLARLAYPRIMRLSRRGFVMPFDGMISNESWARDLQSFVLRYKKYRFQQDKRNFRIQDYLSSLFKAIRAWQAFAPSDGSSGRVFARIAFKLRAKAFKCDVINLNCTKGNIATRSMATTEIFQDWDSPYENLSALRTSTRKTTTKTTRIEIQIQNPNSDFWMSLLIASQLKQKRFTSGIKSSYPARIRRAFLLLHTSY